MHCSTSGLRCRPTLARTSSSVIHSVRTIGVIAYISLVPMSIGNACWFAIVGMLPTNVAGLSSIMVPVVALVSGAIVHGEPLGAMQWLAMLCCVAALSLVLLKPARRLQGPRDAGEGAG